MSVEKKKDNRQLRMKILLGIDTAFLLLELISGIAIGSLALLSDSFHMLNDVCSLVVALQALQLAEKSSASAKYSYGWQRAEVLGALINGVFLLALCFSVGLEAIARFFGDVEVTNPQLMVGVGSAGLLSNIVGLFLFHDHGHSHGGHSHSHGDEEAAKPKRARSHSHSHSRARAPSHDHGAAAPTDRTPLLAAATSSSTSDSTKVGVSPSISESETEDEDEGPSPDEELFVSPAEFRDNIVRAAHDAGYGTNAAGGKMRARTLSTSSSHHGHATGDGHDHDHAHGEDAGHSHGGHSHGGEDGAMNMRGVFLHVLGDALGNVGVIAAGLFIWLTDYSWRMYSDPIVSLVITCIIFSSALPLVKSASFILLQGVPSSVPLDQVRNQISNVKGVLNVHELHIWSLSESKTVCSVHVMTDGREFIDVCRDIRKVLHRFGVHSSTIQPEVVGATPSTSSPEVVEAEQEGCLVACVDDSCRDNACCAVPGDGTATPSSQA